MQNNTLSKNSFLNEQFNLYMYNYLFNDEIILKFEDKLLFSEYPFLRKLIWWK